jgi:cystathionine beta-lyase
MKKPRKTATILTNAGRDPAANHGVVNPPVYRASTIVFETLEELHLSHKHDPKKARYGRHGTPTTFALEEAICELEGGHQSIVVGSGVAAVSATLAAYVKAGDHLLMVDTAYGPTRRFCDRFLGRMGVATTYYDPRIGAGIAELIRPNTRLIFLESPGSLTFEVQDVPAIAAVARKAGVITALDNTWATPLYFKPLAHGVDVSVISATKYIGGHSDLMMGIVTTTERAYRPLRRAVEDFGCASSPDDCYLALRGLRTLGVRLPRHQENGLALARWLKTRPEVARVLHPALPDDPDHALWKRDFTGASGLFSIELKPVPERAVAAMVDGLELFGMGYSWGGYESLILPSDLTGQRTAVPWTAKGPLIRIHAGLEDVDDLLADLSAGFERLRAAAETA